MGKIKTAIAKTVKSTGGKIALGVMGASALGLGARALMKRKGGLFGVHKARRNSVARIRARVQRLAYKIKEKQLKRKLFKEEMRL
jgi:hypothetical protein